MKKHLILISMLALMAGGAMAQKGTPKLLFVENSPIYVSVSREQVTFITHNKNEARTWAKTMENNGYSVSIEYNPRTGVYTCTAVR